MVRPMNKINDIDVAHDVPTTRGDTKYATSTKVSCNIDGD